MPSPQHNFAGFFRRLGATLIDVALIVLVTYPILIAIYGMEIFDYEKTGFVAGPADLLVSHVLPAAVTVWLWLRYRATPGKLAVRAYIVDAATGDPITLRQAVIRYIGYFISLIPLGLGYLWIAFDQKGQGWHDKLAGTVVIHRPSSTAPASEA
jgi:uncharacterized RDD family membrane protein YckC